MPRSKKPARLYLHPERRVWVIRDGSAFISTGCSERDIQAANKKLQAYLGTVHKSQSSGDPLIGDVVLFYNKQRAQYSKSQRSNQHALKNIGNWWGEKNVSEITEESCREYIATKGASVHAARHDLEFLRAALNYWHKWKHHLDRIPAILMPPKAKPRARWLTEMEFARLLKAAGPEHLKRFLLLGWFTGTRPGAILSLEWEWIDLRAGIMHRRAPGSPEDAKKKTPPVRLGEIILTHLKRWHKADGPARKYVVHLDGRKLATVHYSWENAVAAAGLDEKVVRHTLRHSRATNLMRKGIDPWAIAGHLGMTLETLQRVYGHHHPDFQKDVANA